MLNNIHVSQNNDIEQVDTNYSNQPEIVQNENLILKNINEILEMNFKT